jgi:uncharacterized GH25 family protein
MRHHQRQKRPRGISLCRIIINISSSLLSYRGSRLLPCPDQSPSSAVYVVHLQYILSTRNNTSAHTKYHVTLCYTVYRTSHSRPASRLPISKAIHTPHPLGPARQMENKEIRYHGQSPLPLLIRSLAIFSAHAKLNSTGGGKGIAR